MEKQIEKQMRILGISREEAIQLIADDEAIDRGEKLFTLDPQAEQNAKKARQVSRTPTANYQFTPRERKAKPEKTEICSSMMDGLRALGVEKFDVINTEREFLFTLDGIKYKVTLACPRK